MGKPGPLSMFDSKDWTLDEFIEVTKKELDAFKKNMEHLGKDSLANKSKFRWFYQFGFWNEALEFIDEPDFKDYFD